MHKHGWVVAIWLLCGLLLLAGGIAVASRSGEVPPVAIQGVLDLTEWDPSDDPIVLLRGEWEFYWKELLEPSDLPAQSRMTGFIDLPSSWNGYIVDGKKVGAEGYATYVLTLKTRGTGERLAISTHGIATAYKIWVDGELKASVGTVGTSASTMTAGDARNHLEFDADRPETTIVIQASNFLHRRGGVWSDLELGTASTISRQDDWRVLLDAGSFGALSIMGNYHLCLFSQRRRDHTNLYFGWLCIAFSIRALLVGQILVTRVFPEFPWTVAITLEYVTTWALLPLGVAYVESSFPQDVRMRATRFVTAICLAFSSLAVTLGPKVSTRAVIVYQIFDIVVIAAVIARILILAIARKRLGSIAMALGACVFVITSLIDALYFHEFLRIGNLSQLGLVFLCFMQSYSSSLRFSKTVKEVEQLSEQIAVVNTELIDLNRNLESRVEERTAELVESNRKLETINREIARIEAARKHLLANIAHDLRTPVTLIRGYAEAILDGVVEGADAKARYLDLIRTKVDGLAVLIDDLFELTQLEARRTKYSPEILDVVSMVRMMYEKHEQDIRGADLEPRLKLPEPDDSQPPVCINADADHLARVVANLVYNAVKFTPKGGWIEIGCSFEYGLGSEADLLAAGAPAIYPSEAVIKVRDSGPGIDERDVPFVFDRFYKAPKSRTSAAGSGLGLAIAKEIVELHGGRIWVESKLGHGSSFCFSLPTVRAESESF
ncbi:MAG: ATP-binding protein [Bacillota bacterium]|jgi:signal transduction histidine kinase